MIKARLQSAITFPSVEILYTQIRGGNYDRIDSRDE
jgi:hypothetical protein